MRPDSRLRTVLLICLAPVPPIALRLAYLQTIRSDSLIERAELSTERRIVSIRPRGRILDRNGRVLAESIPSWDASLDLKVLKSFDGADSRLTAVARILSLDAKKLHAQSRNSKRTIPLKSRISLFEATELRDLGFKEIAISPAQARHYPNDSLARPLLGLTRSDGTGAEGLEGAFDDVLSAAAVRQIVTRDGAGRSIAETESASEKPARDLVLTIDRTVQFLVEKALDEGLAAAKAKSAVAIVQDPMTGDILAMASRPADPRKNPAAQDVYEPGSTFKIVVAAAALEEKIMGLNDKIDCENGLWQLAPQVRIKDHEKKGPLSLPEILIHSSNIGTGKIGLKLGAKVFMDYSRRFGFGYKTGAPLPGESPGILSDPKSMKEVRLANAAFGQGVGVTALQLVGAYSAVANGGVLMEPRLILSSGDGAPRRPVQIRRVVSEETARAVASMLERVVSEGTGMSARISGFKTAGKTGTAEKFDPIAGGYSKTDFIASFVGWVPADSPRLTILVAVDTPRKGEYGSEVAAPVFAAIARQVLAHFAVAPAQPRAPKIPPPRSLEPSRSSGFKSRAA